MLTFNQIRICLCGLTILFVLFLIIGAPAALFGKVSQAALYWSLTGFMVGFVFLIANIGHGRLKTEYSIRASIIVAHMLMGGIPVDRMRETAKLSYSDLTDSAKLLDPTMRYFAKEWHSHGPEIYREIQRQIQAEKK